MQNFAMDAATWAELNELLDAVLDQPASLRDAWLNALAPQFDGSKSRLRDLFLRVAEAETSDFLNRLPTIEYVAPDADTQAERVGDTVGSYRLIRELGRGGMGAVWLAERSDGLIVRPVALKLPHGSWRRAGLAERMVREREILATLTHPNIARLYDAGLTADGQPYLAIEYVEGQPIDVHCRERQLGLHARLQLFIQVANAVAYAHRNRVVHRDLKPANILVTSDGQVRLLDFGIAELLHEGQVSETPLSGISGRALTPHYASPEQILGAPLTVASDVYSLGVILYELLCGVRAYKLERDLDAIALKALSKDPRQRYPTVHMLVDDIERYLGGWPVLAHPDSLWYRIRKFIARARRVTSGRCPDSSALSVDTHEVAMTRVQRSSRDESHSMDVDSVGTGHPGLSSSHG